MPLLISNPAHHTALFQRADSSNYIADIAGKGNNTGRVFSSKSHGKDHFISLICNHNSYPRAISLKKETRHRFQLQGSGQEKLPSELELGQEGEPGTSTPFSWASSIYAKINQEKKGNYHIRLWMLKNTDRVREPGLFEQTASELKGYFISTNVKRKNSW